MAIVLLHFAKNSGPIIFGELSFYLVLISYSAFAVFGINASYVKHFSINNADEYRDKLTVFNFWYNFVLGLSVFFLIIMLIPKEGALSLAVICYLNLIRGSIQSICRAELKVWRLNIFNAVFSLSYLAAYYWGVVRVGSFDSSVFLYYWALSLVFSMMFGLSLIVPKLIKLSNYSVTFLSANFYMLFKNAIALFVINFGNTILLSSDRFLLNALSAPLEVVGNYQFADNIASIFYLGSNSLLFLLAPVFMRKLSEGSISVEQFKHKFLRIWLLWLLPLIIFIFIAFIVVKFIFTNFNSASSLVVLLTISKFMCLFVFVPVTVLTTFHYEKILLKIYYAVIIPMLFIQALLVINSVSYLLLPLVSVVGVSVILFFLWKVKINQVSPMQGN